MSGTETSLDRREVVRRIVADRGDDLAVITGLGSPAYDLAAAGDHPLDFPLWGAMGGAAMMGLGLALARPDLRVLVLTGDGEQLMGLGALATIGAQRPANLSIAVLDNGLFGETGGQASHTALGTDLAAVARACGFAWAREVRDEAALEEAIPLLRCGDGPGLAAIRVAAGELPRVLPGRDGVAAKIRFRRALGLEPM
ncbi:thiamine pyrophosphate-dependent enzyme [Roseomonas sp. CCTCC AB2023176]|uniref:thiamine pyrophosphate-dependent enzyme n=1 Tax=Roseomonas sp. CCTCC AB2023176 TaxID=3342640 RepID=UPI0035E19584